MTAAGLCGTDYEIGRARDLSRIPASWGKLVGRVEATASDEPV
jgi:hypothetical protein